MCSNPDLGTNVAQANPSDSGPGAPASGFKPLNERLFHLLVRRFGKVHVANRGEAHIGRAVPGENGRMRWVTAYAGEYYCVPCFACRDRKTRLWINHRYGTYEPAVDDTLDYLAYCYRCDGFRAESTRFYELSQLLFGFQNKLERGRNFPVNQGVVIDVETLGTARLPGVVIPLCELGENHPAVVYVRDRGFDVQEVGDVWGAGYCLEGYEPFEVCTHRLIIPVWFRGKLVGWQARALGEGFPKYYTMRGLSKSRMLYNYDRAVESRIVVLVEGALDAWSVGLPAVAMFGKSLSVTQRSILLGGWPRKREPLLVVMLDPEASQEADRIMAECAEMFPHRRVKVELPAGTDPGSLTRDEVWNHIEAATTAAGLNLEDFLQEEASSAVL